MLFFETHSANSKKKKKKKKKNLVEIILSFRKSRAFLIAIYPSSCGILGYRPTAYLVYSITSSGRGGRLANLHTKLFVSLMYNLKFWESGLR